MKAPKCAVRPAWVDSRRGWLDGNGKVARYNVAFINHFLIREDHGRVLGYDNSHGYHHRHFKGQTEPFDYTDCLAVFDRFVEEVRELRKEEP